MFGFRIWLVVATLLATSATASAQTVTATVSTSSAGIYPGLAPVGDELPMSTYFVMGMQDIPLDGTDLDPGPGVDIFNYVRYSNLNIAQYDETLNGPLGQVQVSWAFRVFGHTQITGAPDAEISNLQFAAFVELYAPTATNIPMPYKEDFDYNYIVSGGFARLPDTLITGLIDTQSPGTHDLGDYHEDWDLYDDFGNTFAATDIADPPGPNVGLDYPSGTQGQHTAPTFLAARGNSFTLVDGEAGFDDFIGTGILEFGAIGQANHRFVVESGNADASGSFYYAEVQLTVTYTPVAVPEPGSLALMGLVGVAGLVVYRRRSKLAAA